MRHRLRRRRDLLEVHQVDDRPGRVRARGTVTRIVSPTPFRRCTSYDEQRVLLDHVYGVGDTIRVTVPASTNAAWTIIDLMDFEKVAPPTQSVPHSVSVLDFGADPTGNTESSNAFDAAIAAAKAAHKTVFIPAGTYQVNRHIVVDDVTIEGAGNCTRSSAATGHACLTTTGRLRAYGRRLLRQVRPRTAAVAITSTCRTSRSRATSANVWDTDQANGVGGAAQRLVRLWALHPSHEGGPLVRRADARSDVSNTIVADVLADASTSAVVSRTRRSSNSFFRKHGGRRDGDVVAQRDGRPP